MDQVITNKVNEVADRAGTIDQDLILANAQLRYAVRAHDLPLSCPMPGMYLWNSHPKVYLSVEEAGEVRCPYCGADYFFENDTNSVK
jgi:uncharacterized Zn-finger protein